MGTLTQPTSYFSGGFVVNGQIQFAGGLSVDNDIVDASSGTVIWDSGNDYLPTNALENDSVTISAGDGLSSGGSVSLGDSVSLEVNVSDIAGGGLQDDAGDLALINDSVTISASTGLTGGGDVSLGGSTSISLTNDSITINGTSVALGDSISLSTGVDLADDEKGTFGDDNDFSVRYDSTADSLSWQDGINAADRMELDRSTGNLSIGGSLTEGSAL